MRPIPPVEPGQLVGRVSRFSVLGVGWRIDGPVGRSVGRLLAEAPWLVPALLAAYSPWRRALGRAVETPYTAAPARRARRRLPGARITLAPEVEAGWPLRLCARCWGLEVGRVEVTPAGELRGLWVRNLWRGLGLGRRLVAAAVDGAGRRGLAELRAEVPPEDGRARALLAGAGFTAEGTGWLVRRLDRTPAHD